MFSKIHNILGKVFLSCTAFFWASCTDSNSDIPVGPSNIANENSSSSEAYSSSEQLSSSAAQSSSSEVPSSSSEAQTNSSSSNKVPSSSSISVASSSSEKASITCKESTSSSSAKREPPQKASFDIEQTLSVMSHDTTGLVGQCISAEQYCAIQKRSNPHDFHEYAEDKIERNQARYFVNSELDSLLESPRGATFSEEKRKCILNLKYTYSQLEMNNLLYGVPPWDLDCKGKDTAQIDENYIKAFLKLDSLAREEYKKILKETNEKAAHCDSLE